MANSNSNDFILLEISEDSHIPKYKQIVNSIIAKIETGHIKFGQRIPSINNLSTDYLLSRDTVEKAYNELKERGVIESVKKKGFYVSNSAPESQFKILILFNKLSAYKKEIYNTIDHQLEEKAQIDFFIYHCDYELFERILREHYQGYHYYVIMLHFADYNTADLKRLLGNIPSEKIIIIDHRLPGIDYYFGCVYQDFKMDIFNALAEALVKIRKYKKLILVFPDSKNYPYPKEIIIGFTRFCSFNKVRFEIIHSISSNYKLEKNTSFVVIEDNDLANLIKLVKLKNYILGEDIGIISYNDTILKEVLADGITVISTDFQKMGGIAANMILENKPLDCKNDFHLIMRNSL